MDTPAQVTIPPGKYLVFFDGVCNLCNGFVNFIIDHDPEGLFVFESLQSKYAAAIIGSSYTTNMDSVVVRSADGSLYQESDAALFIISRLKGWVSIFKMVRFIPRNVRNMVYKLIARYRYQWLGKRDVCRVPTEDSKSRFLQAYQSM